MATHSTRRLAAWTVALLLAAAGRSRADEIKRIRTDSQYLEIAIADAADRSPTLRAIIREIQASNVIVHVTCGQMRSSTLEGRTMWVASNGGARYLRVQVECMLQRTGLVAILGHELQHVAEIAAANEVVDERSFARLFKTIGFSTCHFPEQFETDRAILAGERIRREVVAFSP